MVGSPHSRSEIAAWNTSSYGHNSLAAPREIYYQDGPSQSIQNSPKTNRHAPPALSSEPPKQVISRELPVDYRMLLLALADQYISAARSLSIQIAYQQSGREQYQKLMATGLGCMEQVLKKQAWRLAPRQEAVVHLRYATLLYEETENVQEAEELLGKAVVFCQRNRLLDLKYSMQELLVRLLFKSKSRSWVKVLDHVIKECETCQYIPWVYAFRFLKTSLYFEVSNIRDVNAAIASLRSVAALSKQYSDAAVRMTASVLEAAMHLQIRKGDWLTETQQALATARAQQSSFSSTQLPQLQILIHLSDLACSLDPYDAKPAQSKMQAMHALMDSTLSEVSLSVDGNFVVPLNLRGYQGLVADAHGTFPRSKSGEQGLALTWLGKNDIYTLGYVLSSATTFAKKTSGDAGKTEFFLQEGLKLTEDDASSHGSSGMSLALCCARVSARRELRCYLLLQLAFAECNRSEWSSAWENLINYQQTAPKVPSNMRATLYTASTYLQGVLFQGTSDLRNALETYQSLYQPLQSTDTATLLPEKFYAILATMNTLFILRPPDHPQHHLISPLLNTLRPHFNSAAKPSPAASQNPHLASAYSFLLAVLPQHLTQSTLPHYTSPISSTSSFQPTGDNNTTQAITPTKFHLQTSLSAAKRASNALMATLCLCYTNHFLYQGIVSEQAVSAAKVAESVANQAGCAVWIEFARGCLRETLEREGGGGGGGMEE